MSESQDLVSIGCVAGELQTPVRDLSKILAELGIEPKLRLNRVDYFGGADVTRLAAHIRAQNPRTTNDTVR